MNKPEFEVARLAKQYFRDGLAGTPPEEMREDALVRMLPGGVMFANKNQQRAHDGAKRLLGSALVAISRRDGKFTFETVDAEINRRVSMMAEGWESVGGQWIKKFPDAAGCADLFRVMKETGLGAWNPQPIQDATNAVRIDSNTHETLLLFLEGRAMEIERGGKS